MSSVLLFLYIFLPIGLFPNPPTLYSSRPLFPLGFGSDYLVGVALVSQESVRTLERLLAEVAPENKEVMNFDPRYHPY